MKKLTELFIKARDNNSGNEMVAFVNAANKILFKAVKSILSISTYDTIIDVRDTALINLMKNLDKIDTSKSNTITPYIWAIGANQAKLYLRNKEKNGYLLYDEEVIDRIEEDVYDEDKETLLSEVWDIVPELLEKWVNDKPKLKEQRIYQAHCYYQNAFENKTLKELSKEHPISYVHLTKVIKKINVYIKKELLKKGIGVEL